MGKKSVQERIEAEINDPNFLQNTLNEVNRAERASARTKNQREMRDSFREIASILRRRGQ
ncbi:MAG: hypothetical protein SFZ02_12400 [bacterium]|nr:hypothetical protein [bacterium]